MNMHNIESLSIDSGFCEILMVLLVNISAKNYQNRLMCVEVIVCYIIVVFLTHGVERLRVYLIL